MIIGWLVFGPFLWALLCALAGSRKEEARNLVAAVAAISELVLSVCLLFHSSAWSLTGILAGGLSFGNDGFRSVYSILTSFLWAACTLFSREYFAHEPEHLNRLWFFMLVTLGAVQGVMLSRDFMTAFIFFEILSFTSFTWVIHEETKEAIHAGVTYLFIAVIGGLSLFLGLAFLQHETGTLAFDSLRVATAGAGHPALVLAAGFCILAGFGAKAGMFPLHVWLPKAHPAAPSPASALLSGILTKVGVYGILMLALTAMAGNRTFGVVLLFLGVITMFLGALMGLFSVHLKHTLACSSMSQIGFILTGLGTMMLLEAAGHEEAAGMALCGAMLHMVNHSLLKLTLFLCAGVVVMNLQTAGLNDIRGWGRNKPALMIAFGLGGLGISGVPLFNGYLSKTLLHEGIVEASLEITGSGKMFSVIEWIFLISGGMTFAYMLKLFVCLFVERGCGSVTAGGTASVAVQKAMRPLTAAVVLGSSLLMIVLGQPFLSTRLVSYMTGNEHILSFRAFTPENLKGSLISLGIGAVLYLLVVRGLMTREGKIRKCWPAWLDLEESVYRPALTKIFPEIFGRLAAVFAEHASAPLWKTSFSGFAHLAGIFAENRLLLPLAEGILLAGELLGRLMDIGTDGMILLLRSTLFRERKVQGAGEQRAGLLRRILVEMEDAGEPLAANFTTALFLTCVGILIILGAILIRAGR